MKRFLAFPLISFAMGNISCDVSTQTELQISSNPVQAEAMPEVQTQKSENFEGIYRTAYDYLLEHPVKNKPKECISAIILKRATNQFTDGSELVVRYLILMEEGEYRLMRDGNGFYPLDIDAMLDPGDHIIINKGLYGGHLAFSKDSKIIKKEAVKIPRQESPIPLFIPKKEEKEN